MGSPPPPDLPPPDTTTHTLATPGPPVSALCGFVLPTLPNFLPGFSLPLDALSFPPPLPLPKLPLSIDCSQNNPQDVSSGLEYGGGRMSNADPSPDLDENNQ